MTKLQKARRYVLEELLRGSQLTPADRAVWHAIAGFGDTAGNVITQPPSLTEIAEASGLGRRAVINRVGVLVESGWLMRAKGNGRQRTVYRLSSPSDPSPPFDPADIPVQRQPKHDPVVYFVIIGSQVKIGTTTDVGSRFQSMLPPLAEVFTIPGSYPEEQQHHLTFHEDRVGNTEWFRYSDRLRNYVASLVASGEARRHRAPVL